MSPTSRWIRTRAAHTIPTTMLRMGPPGCTDNTRMEGEGEEPVDDYPLSNPDITFGEWIFPKYMHQITAGLCSHIPVAAEQRPRDGQTNWPRTWWGAGWDSVLRGACCPPVAVVPHCSNASPSHCSTGTESWTHTPTHGQDRRGPETRSGWQREACPSCPNCCERKFSHVKYFLTQLNGQSDSVRERSVTHSGERNMVSSLEVVGAERVRSHSLTRESWDALVPGTVELTSILTCPRLTGVAPRYA